MSKTAYLAGLILVALAACTTTPPVNDIPNEILSASTPADHTRLADYFAKKSADYNAEAVLHEKMALSYNSRPKGDYSSMASHCRTLAAQFHASAREAKSLESEHRALAK
ncbi:hypothetical protein [Uliginosibacterium gangwonense]|uniref:hypothetical protein n=1 Tax=Uliginosibacterium gangwonense TaxID=392736 RepID=UPI0003710892|nr:hypothetical protein [Uliginosibacterium gangwonense]